jgi:nucleotide-binding universal stress UspA family protein
MKVLIATDGSLHAEKAARFFSALPHREPLELLVVAVHYLPEIHGTPAVMETIDDYEEVNRARLQQACGKIVSMFDGALVKTNQMVPEGHPGETLLDIANNEKAELIVLGAVGHSMLESILLGSVSEFVVTHAKCSVLVVRNTLLDQLHEHPLRICYAYDGSERCRAALNVIGRFDWRPDMRVDMLGIIRLPTIYSDVPVTIDTSALKVETALALQQASSAATVLSNNVHTHVRESYHIGEAIVQFCRESDSQIVLCGDTGRGIVSRFFLGSAARYVLREGSCSVWIGR